MIPSLELTVVVWLQYFALKLLWKIWESDVKDWRHNEGLGLGHTSFKKLVRKRITNIFFLSHLEYSIQLLLFFGPIWILWHLNDFQISKFWKNDRRSHFTPQKNHMIPNLELTIVAWLQYFGKVTSKTPAPLPPPPSPPHHHLSHLPPNILQKF